MKVCIVSINIYSLFNSKSKAPIGGTEVQLFNIAKHLREKNEISIITGDWEQEQKKETHGTIKVYKSFSLKKTWVNYIIAPFIFWQKMKQVDAEVYIASSAGIEIGLSALFCRVYKKKFIYRTAHQMDCDGEFVKKNGWRGKVYEYGLKHADIVVTQNKEHQKLLKLQKIEAVVIKNGFKISEKDIKINNKKYILWVARCDQWKHPELFLKIVSRFPQEKFIMISPRVAHEKKLFHKIRQEASKLSNLKFIEKIEFFKIQRYFDEAKVFIGTSDYEGFPNTYLQACLGGTPIVSLKVNPDNFITKNNLGYCAKSDFNNMLEQIKELITDYDSWNNKSVNAIRYVKKEHNIETTGKKWEDIINKFK